MKIHDALVAFQKAGVTISKNAVNPHFRSKYADLPGIIKAINPVLSEIGLSITHRVVGSELVTALATDEDKIESSFPLFGSKPQEFGSSITYAKRYNIGALLNLDIDDDDDGNQANEAKRIVKKKKFDQEAFTRLHAVKQKFQNAEEAIEAAKKSYDLDQMAIESITSLYS